MKTIITLLSILWTTMLWGQSMQQLNNAEKLRYLFEKLDKNSLNLVTEFYHADVDFIDPVGKIKGAQGIKNYYQGMYKNVKSIRFDFDHIYESGNTVIGVWTMTLETDKLNGGEAFKVEGNSVVTFDKDGKAIYHRDYFDMGAFVYERIPVIGYIIKKLRQNMEHTPQ